MASRRCIPRPSVWVSNFSPLSDLFLMVFGASNFRPLEDSGIYQSSLRFIWAFRASNRVFRPFKDPTPTSDNIQIEFFGVFADIHLHAKNAKHP